MAEYLKEIIKLTSEQLTILSKDGSLKIGDKTYLYEPLTTIYLTPDTTQEQLDAIITRLSTLEQNSLVQEDLSDYAKSDEIDTKIAELVGTDAETLETLQNLSQAIEEHEDVVTTLNEAITSKASQESVDLLTDRVTELENNADGRQIELQVSDTHIQWKYVKDTEWIDLVALSSLKGDKGDTGVQGPQGETGATGAVGARFEYDESTKTLNIITE